MSYVGMVLVSHSHELVNGLRSLLSQVEPNVPIAVAGGTDEDEIGTSALKIKRAIESVYSDYGVIILFDIGSSLLNTKLAIEWLGEGRQVRIADASLVEGAFSAVVEAGFGSSLDQVLAAAEEAKSIKKL
jgi:dihydroxyacetone kinase phosphotransfer subunit